ncbi:MAG: hypothetical protein AAGL69_16205 [Pseudomonadota bacterium]
MRRFVSQIVILSMLFMSIEGASDMLLDGVPHGNDAAHAAEFGHALDKHDGSVSDSQLDGDHCEHCCHGHCTAIVSQVDPCVAPLSTDERRGANQNVLRNFAQAPPTPPPNA